MSTVDIITQISQFGCRSGLISDSEFTELVHQRALTGSVFTLYICVTVLQEPHSRNLVYVKD